MMNPLEIIKTWFDSERFADDVICMGLLSFVIGTWAAREGFTIIADIFLGILVFIFLAPVVIFFLASIFRR